MLSMNISYRFLIITLFFITLSHSFIYGNTPKLKQTVKFIEVEKVDSDAKAGVVNLAIKILPEIDITGLLLIRANHNVSIIQGHKNLKEIRQSVSFSKNQIITLYFRFNQKTKYPDMFQIFLETPDAPAGYSRTFKRFFKIYNDGETIHLIDPRNNQIFKTKESGKDFIINQGKTTEATTMYWFSQNWNFKKI